MPPQSTICYWIVETISIFSNGPFISTINHWWNLGPKQHSPIACLFLSHKWCRFLSPQYEALTLLQPNLQLHWYSNYNLPHYYNHNYPKEFGSFNYNFSTSSISLMALYWYLQVWRTIPWGTVHVIFVFNHECMKNLHSSTNCAEVEDMCCALCPLGLVCQQVHNVMI